MDQIFDRLGRLINSFFLQGDDDDESSSSVRGSSGDSDYDSAMEELDNLLRPDLTESEKRDREAARRAEEERARRQHTGPASGAGGQVRRPAGPPQGLIRDYELLGVPYGSKLDAVKTAYKGILKAYHPDRHAGNPENLKKATEYSARVNAAYQRIETWLQTGKYEVA